jgi:hypothetical protein
MGGQRPGLWMIQFTASDGEQATGYARRAAGALQVAAAGRYGFAAVGTHQQVIALRDEVTDPACGVLRRTPALVADLYAGRQESV